MNLLAVSDLHVRHAENRDIVEGLRPATASDWLIVAGDVAEVIDDTLWALRLLRERFAVVIWAPGNHELMTVSHDPVRLRGEERYRHLVDQLRAIDVLTPEDEYPVWTGPNGPAVVAPLFVLYDYTFRVAGATTKEQSLAAAFEAGIICVDEALLHPDPYPSREAWCQARLDYTRARLDAIDTALPTVLVNHFPLVREPTRILRYPQFAQWCGTEATADWHLRYRSLAVVYGHLHIPRTIACDEVPHIEVSLGYPREWQSRAAPPRIPHQILPVAS